MSTTQEAPLRFEASGHDIEQARSLFEEGYNGDDFEFARTDRPFAYRHTAVGDQQMSLHSTLFVGSASGTVQPKDEYIVSWITAGRGVIDLGADETALAIGRPTMFPTGKPFAFHLVEVQQNLVHFDARYLETIAAERTGAMPRPLHFHHQIAPSDQALARWKTTITTTARAILGGDSGSLLRSEVNRIAANALLDTFAFEATEPAALLSVPRHAKLRAAIEFMHTHAERPLAAAEIAEAAGLSLRGLQHVFSLHLDTTPTEYLRGVRLERVRDELRSASPDEATVSAVARRWGFGHPGRFAGSYLKRFGEYPAATLSR